MKMTKYLLFSIGLSSWIPCIAAVPTTQQLEAELLTLPQCLHDYHFLLNNGQSSGQGAGCVGQKTQQSCLQPTNYGTRYQCHDIYATLTNSSPGVVASSHVASMPCSTFQQARYTETAYSNGTYDTGKAAAALATDYIADLLPCVWNSNSGTCSESTDTTQMVQCASFGQAMGIDPAIFNAANTMSQLPDCANYYSNSNYINFPYKYIAGMPTTIGCNINSPQSNAPTATSTLYECLGVGTVYSYTNNPSLPPPNNITQTGDCITFQYPSLTADASISIRQCDSLGNGAYQSDVNNKIITCAQFNGA